VASLQFNTTLPHPSQDKDERNIQRQILILIYQTNTRRSRRDDKEPKEISEVSCGRRECKVRDQTEPKEKKMLST